MKNRISRLTVSSLLLIAATSATAQQTSIQCPAQVIDTDVTTQLPDGWWSTSQRGRLSDTEVIAISGSPKLVCVYKMSSTEVTVMRDAPEGMSCSAAGTGFRCQAGSAGNSAVKKTIEVDGQARADNNAVAKSDNTLTPGNVRKDAPVREADRKTIEIDGQARAGNNKVIDSGTTLAPGNVKKEVPVQAVDKGACPDPMLTGVEVRMLSRDPQGQYFFRLAATVENRGRGAFTSRDGQQVVRIEQISQGGPPRQIAVGSFRNIPAGGSAADITHDVLRWRIGDEFPPSYRFTIAYDPDIAADGNPSNDDCELRNNSTTISGAEINSIIRGSGI